MAFSAYIFHSKTIGKYIVPELDKVKTGAELKQMLERIGFKAGKPIDAPDCSPNDNEKERQTQRNYPI